MVTDDTGASRSWRGLAGAVALAALAACAPQPLPPGPDAAPAPEATSAPGREPGPDEPPAAVADNSSAARADRVAALPPERARRREPPARLVGLSREHLLDVLGPAGFVRRDGPVQIWRYSNDECFLDVFLYRGGDGFHVDHVEARTKGAAQIALDDCYGRLVAERRGD